MKKVINHNLIPAFNLALEEYLLRGLKMPCVMLWRNSPAVIIGSNQNAFAEINRKYVESHNIAVIRRQTGGGAVYHDLGNINYTFITDKTDNIGNYSTFTEDLRDFLSNYGVKAELSGRDDLTVNGKKFCGNAQSLSGGLMIHHGCILFDTDLTVLSKALNANPLKFKDKAIKSVHSRVTNLKEYLPFNSAEEFISAFNKYLDDKYCPENYILTENDILAVNKKAEEKYGNFSWNYGASPLFNYERTKKFGFGIVSVLINVENGKVKDFNIYGDFFCINELEEFKKQFLGKEFIKEKFIETVNKNDVADYIQGFNNNDFIDLIFN